MTESSQELTLLLHEWSEGGTGVEDRLVDVVYPLLRRLAARQLAKEGPKRVLATTELAHEAYLDLFRGKASIDWQDRRHFYSLAAQVIRRVVVDFARERQSLKRGGEAIWVAPEGVEPFIAPRDEDLLALDEALVELAEIDPEAARITELRFFGGMNAEEIAETCEISTATVGRRWRFARAWLRQRLDEVPESDRVLEGEPA